MGGGGGGGNYSASHRLQTQVLAASQRVRQTLKLQTPSALGSIGFVSICQGAVCDPLCHWRDEGWRSERNENAEEFRESGQRDTDAVAALKP